MNIERKESPLRGIFERHFEWQIKLLLIYILKRLSELSLGVIFMCLFYWLLSKRVGKERKNVFDLGIRLMVPYLSTVIIILLLKENPFNEPLLSFITFLIGCLCCYAVYAVGMKIKKSRRMEKYVDLFCLPCARCKYFNTKECCMPRKASKENAKLLCNKAKLPEGEKIYILNPEDLSIKRSYYEEAKMKGKEFGLDFFLDITVAMETADTFFTYERERNQFRN